MAGSAHAKPLLRRRPISNQRWHLPAFSRAIGGTKAFRPSHAQRDQPQGRNPTTAVAHLDHSLEVGGAELALVRMLQEGVPWKYLLCLPHRAPGSPEDVFSSIDDRCKHRAWVTHPAGTSRAGALGTVGALTRILFHASQLRLAKRFRAVDIVHANTSRAALIAWASVVGSDRLLVIHLRDNVDAEALGPWGYRALRLALSRADGVIANSRFTLDSASPILKGSAKRVVVSSPIGLKSPHNETLVPPTVERVGILGRLTPWKGQDIAIRAFAAAFSDSQVVLEIAGSAAFSESIYAQELRSLCRELRIEDRVRFLGQVDDIWGLIDQWDICIHASVRPEPLGQTVLQYLAACKPTIAAAAGGPLEWITDGVNGLLFEPGDELSLAENLIRLATDQGVRQGISRTLASERLVPTDQQVLNQYKHFFETLVPDLPDSEAGSP
ncbi:glycosyltransferase [Nocardioides sp. zg-579]|uniref:Glycosyltransferase n=1 Tax=Nocardioides marmotae TaxID=2663857 RepID=A0A6I3JCH2_9ACTN|nr:glycosyltransferase [Nocardioides marmotae]MCR6032181.1 glycosyltransferase [Gordonia jinghuaiqii]MTB95827.1 glycosyltransferase [Nocardioides marmotae]QKE02820.1 glycosyltransferase [Nocardioides marmotae]